MTDRIAVVGAGQMGNGIAHVFAQSGFAVTMVDVSEPALARGRSTIEKNLDRQVKKGTMDEAAKQATLGRLATSGDLGAVGDSALVVEAATESRELKFRIFADLDRLAPPGAVLASNTSSISITEIGARTKRPEQVVGMHFMNPVPVMQLVEIIRGLATSDATTKLVTEMCTRLGKTPVEVNDFPGFVSNRVLMPMINEAFYAWMEGVAEPDAIDGIMKLGCNFPMGPLRLADFIGLDTCVHIMNVLADGLNNDRYRACPLLKQLVAAGRLGDKTGRGVFEYPAK